MNNSITTSSFSSRRSRSTRIFPFNREIDNKSIDRMTPIDLPASGKNKDKRDTVVALIILILGQTLSLISVSIWYLFYQVIIVDTNKKIGCIYVGIFYIIFGCIWLLINKCQLSLSSKYAYLLVLFESQSIFLRILAIQQWNISNEYIFQLVFFSPFIVFLIKRFYFNEKRLTSYHYFMLFLEIISMILFSIGSFYDENSSLFTVKVLPLYGSVILECLFYALLEHKVNSNNDIYKYFPFSLFIGTILVIEGMILKEYSNFSIKILNWDNMFYIVMLLLLKMVYNALSPFFIRYNDSILFTLNLSSNCVYWFFIKMIFDNRNYLNGVCFYLGLLGMMISLFVFEKIRLLKNKRFYDKHKEAIKNLNPNQSGLLPDMFSQDGIGDNDNKSSNSYFDKTDDMLGKKDK